MHGTWSIFSSHGLVLFYLATNPRTTLRAVSDALGLSERWVSSIVGDLIDAEMIEAERQGRRNRYRLNPDAKLRHPTLTHVRLRHIVGAVGGESARNDP